MFENNDPALGVYYFFPPTLEENNPPDVGLGLPSPPNVSLGAY